MARTLLGGLGHATLKFLVVAARLFLAFCVCPKFCNLAKQRRKRFWGVSEVGGWVSGEGTYAQDSVVVVEGTGPASRVGSVLCFLWWGCVRLRVCASRWGGLPCGRWAAKGLPCCPCVQGGRGGPSPCMVYCSLCRWSVMWTLGAGGSYTWVVRVRGAGDIDLGGVVLAGSGVWHDVLGCPLVVGGFLWVEWVWRWGFVLGLRVRRYFGLDQVLWPTWAAAAVAARKRATLLGSRGGALGQGVRVLWSWFAHQIV